MPVAVHDGVVIGTVVGVVGVVCVVGAVTHTPEEHSKPAAVSQAPAKLAAALSPQAAPAASL